LLERLFGKTNEAQATESELAVATKILGTDDQSRLLIDQLQRANSVRRSHPDRASFLARPVSPPADLLIRINEPRIDSDWLAVTDAATGRALQFRVTLVQPGLLYALEGRTRDGQRWPDKWGFDPTIDVQSYQRLTLPSRQEIEAAQQTMRTSFEAWVGRAVPATVEFYPPPSEAQLAARELELGGHFPAELRKFFSVTDGLDFGDLRLYDFAHAYTIDSVYLPALLMAWDSDPDDDFVVVVSLSGRDENVYRIDIHQPDPRPEPIATNFRAYLASRLTAPARG
jgi:hypothetical protein